jgi:hypothetical protein
LVPYRVPLESWVNLPRLGKDAFRELMKAGVEYSTGKGFLLRADIDLSAAKQIISAAVGGEVFFVFKCYVCNSEASCADCKYREICSIEKVGGKCVCSKCAGEGIGAYRDKWKASVGRP